MPINPHRAIDYFKTNLSHEVDGMSDYDIFEYAKGRFPKYEKEFSGVDNPFQRTEIPAPPKNTKTFKESRHDPDTFDKMLGAFNFADMYAEEGEGVESLGISPEFFKKAYNESMAGLLYAAKNGEFKYDIGDYDPSVWAEIGQFAVGLLNPIDATAFGALPMGGSKVGATVAGKTITKWGNKGLANGVRGSIATKPLANSVYNGVLQQGLGFGAYSAAAGAIGNAAQQSTKQGDYADGDGTIDGWEVAKAATSHGAEGILLGAVTGATGRGIGSKFATWHLSKDAGKLAKLSKKALNTGTQVGVEAAEFTAIPYMIHGSPENSDQFKRDFIHNLGIISVLKGSTGSLFKQGQHDVKEFIRSIKETTETRIKQKTKGDKAFDNVKNATEDPEVKSDITKAMEEDSKKIHGTTEGLEELEIRLGRATELLKKKKLTPDEEVELFDLSSNLPILEGLYLEVLENEDFRKEIGLGEIGEATKTTLESKLNIIGEARTKVNDIEGMLKEQRFQVALKEGQDVKVGFDGNEKDGFRVTIRDAEGNVFRTQETKTVEGAKRLQEEWQNEVKLGMKGKKVTGIEEKEDIVSAVEGQSPEIDSLVSKLAGELKIAPEKIRADKEYHTGILDETGNPYLSFDKLQKSYDAIQKDKPGTPQSELTKIISEMDVNAVKSQDIFNKRIGNKDPIKDYIETLDLNPQNEKMLIQGISEFMGERSPNAIKHVSDYVKWLQEKGKSVSDANTKLTEQYIVEKQKGAEGQFRTKAQRKVLNDSLSAFYGTGGTGIQHIPEGFSYSYMGEKGVNPRVSTFEGRKPRPASQEKIAIAPPEQYSKIQATKKTLVESGENLKGARKQEIDPLTYDTATEMMYEFGSRGADTLNRLYIENIDWKNGIIKEWSTGEAQKGVHPRENLPLKEVIPELWNKLVKIKGDREKGNLFIDTKGKNVLGESINLINKQIMPEGVKLRGKKGKLTVADYRKMVNTDAQSIGGSKMREFTDIVLVGHVPKSMAELYTFKDIAKQWKEFRQGRDKLSKPEIKEKKFLKLDEAKTPEQLVEYLTEQKKRLKDRGQKDEGGQLGIQLAQAKKLVQFNKAMKEMGWDDMPGRAELMKQLGLKDIKEKRAEHLKEEIVFKGKAVEKQRKKFIEDVMRRNNLTEESLKQVGLDKGVLGEWGDGMIKLQKGEWQPADFYHENLHRLKEFANLTDNKKLQRLVKQGERLAKGTKEYAEWKKNNPKRNVEEFLADIVGGKASKMQFSKGMLPKIKQFVNQLVSTVKSALGFGSFQDYSSVLAGKVRKGFKTGDVKFGKEIKQRDLSVTDRDSLAKEMRADFNNIVEKVIGEGEKVGSSQKKSLRKLMAEMAEIDKPRKFDFNAKMSTEDLLAFRDVLTSENVRSLRKQKDIVEWMRSFNAIDKFRKSGNITDANQKFLLKSLGVEDGNIYNTSVKKLGEYNALLKTMGLKKEGKMNWVEEARSLDFVTKEQSEMILKAGEFGAAVLPIEMVIRNIGFNKLADKLFAHTAQETKYIGRMTEMEEGIIRIVGGTKNFDNMKDMFYLADNKRRAERIKEGMLTNPEKDFISKAFTKDAKGNETLNLNSPEGKALAEVDKFNKDFKQYTEDVLREILNDAEYEAFMKENNIRWIKDGIYIHRGVTEAFKDVYNMDSTHLSTIIEKEAIPLSTKLAKEHYASKGHKKPSEELVKMKSVELREQAKEMVRAQMYDLMHFSSARYQSRFAMKRHEKLPERYWSEAQGKYIDVYETSYDATIRKYSLGMGKFLSNLEFFPEHVKLKGLKFKTIKSDLVKLKEMPGGDKWFDYVVRNLEGHLGIGKDSGMFKGGQRFMNDYATILAKIQLSSPTSGLKNFLVGQPQTIGAFGARRWFSGILSSFSKDARRSIREAGHTEVGLRHIDNNLSIFGDKSNWVQKQLDKVFWVGGMRPTENINRYVAVQASRFEQASLVNTIKDKGNTDSKQYKNAMVRLKKFYKLNSEDIKLLEEYGMEGANGLSKTNVVDIPNIERRMEQIYHKMDTAAHIYTQGATIDIFMPEIAGWKGVKPLTLYKRMAYAATVNTYNNMKLAHETGSYSRMLMQTLGGLVAGQTMIGVYDAFLGQAPPKQNGEWWEQLFITMWKGEMGGLLSEGFRVAAGVPGSSLVEHTVRPAIYDHATMLLGVASDGINKKVNLSQGFDKILRSSFGAYHQGKKMLERKVSPYNGGYLEYRKLYGEFMQSAKPEKGDIEIAKTENSPYFVDFRNAFNLGTEKEFAKQYILSTLAMASDYYREGYASTGIRVRTMQQAYKQALKTMDLKMTLLNPNKGTPAKDSIVSRLRAKQFLSFLTPEQLKEVNNLESQYWAKRRRYMSSLSKYFKEFNVPEMKKDFDWD